LRSVKLAETFQELKQVWENQLYQLLQQ
jgi:hypothetical protein